MKLSGLGISHGLAIGEAFIHRDLWESDLGIQGHFVIEKDQVQPEYARIEAAVQNALKDLEGTASRTEHEIDGKAADVFRAQQAILCDPVLLGEIREKLQVELISAEEVVRRVFHNWERKFLAMEAQLFKDRADDVADLGRRLLQGLVGIRAHPLENVPAGSVLVSRRLLPSDAVFLSRRSAVAVVVEWGGRLSHAALLTRQMGIPAVSQVPGLLDDIRPEDKVLVDGTRGTLVINPNAEMESRFRRQVEQRCRASSQARKCCREPARTRGGTLVEVMANIGGREDAQLAAENGADGVGLFRIEGIYLPRKSPPSEKELLSCLRHALEPIAAKPVTVRLLDAGGDKALPFLHFPPEPDPSLGRRGVRLLLEYPELLNTQLRALLRLAQSHEVRILVPMVTVADEVRRVRQLLEETAGEIHAENLPPLGAMIETPAAALCVREVAEHADFLSIGSNDLTQYTMAAGRESTLVSKYFVDDHPAVLKLIQIVTENAQDMRLSVCGELASRPDAIPVLVGLHVRALSVPPPLIPEVKEAVRTLPALPHHDREPVPVS